MQMKREPSNFYLVHCRTFKNISIAKLLDRTPGQPTLMGPSLTTNQHPPHPESFCSVLLLNYLLLFLSYPYTTARKGSEKVDLTLHRRYDTDNLALEVKNITRLHSNEIRKFILDFQSQELFKIRRCHRKCLSTRDIPQSFQSGLFSPKVNITVFSNLCKTGNVSLILTQAMSKRVFLALQGSSIPIPMVTL